MILARKLFSSVDVLNQFDLAFRDRPISKISFPLDVVKKAKETTKKVFSSPDLNFKNEMRICEVHRYARAKIKKRGICFSHLFYNTKILAVCIFSGQGNMYQIEVHGEGKKALLGIIKKYG